MGEIFQCVYYFVLIVLVIASFVYAKRYIDKPSSTEILLEQQNDLLRYMDNTLTGIDTRLREIQENKGFINDK